MKGNKDKIKKAIHHNDLELKCLNASLSWERAYVDAENNVYSPIGISIADVISAASDVQSEFCVPVQRLKEDGRDELLYLLIEFFPIMLAEKHKRTVLIVNC